MSDRLASLSPRASAAQSALQPGSPAAGEGVAEERRTVDAAALASSGASLDERNPAPAAADASRLGPEAAPISASPREAQQAFEDEIYEWCEGQQNSTAQRQVARELCEWRAENAGRRPEETTQLRLWTYELPVPPQIGQLTNLRSLDISKTTHLPAEIGNLVHLKKLSVKHSEIEHLPPAIGRLANLRGLSVTDSRLRQLPAEIGDLRRLEDLDFSHNYITGLPDEIGQLTDLQQLSVRDNRMTRLPQQIGSLRNLRELRVDQTPIEELPREIGQLANLQKLFVGSSNLTRLPVEVGNLQNLLELDVSHSLIEELPAEIGQLVNLQILHAELTQLTRLPREVGNLHSLRTLDLEDSPIESLPPELGRLQLMIYRGDIAFPEPPPPAFLAELIAAQNAQHADEEGNATPDFLMRTLVEIVSFTRAGEAIPDADSFIEWLGNIQRSEDFTNPQSHGEYEAGLKRFLADVLADDELRALCCQIAFQYSASCEDGGAAAYAEMKKAALLAQFFVRGADGSQVLRAGVTAQQVLNGGVDMFVIQLVERAARAKISQLRNANGGGVGAEELETMLRFQTGMRAELHRRGIRLELPNAGMRYAEIAAVTDAEILAAANVIESLCLDGRALAQFLLTEWAPLSTFVELAHPLRFEHVRQLSHGMLADLATQQEDGVINEGAYLQRVGQVTANLARIETQLRQTLMQQWLDEHQPNAVTGAAAAPVWHFVS